MRLNYLAPDIVVTILNGRQPVGLTASQLISDTRLPLEWSRSAQRWDLGEAGLPEKPGQSNIGRQWLHRAWRGLSSTCLARSQRLPHHRNWTWRPRPGDGRRGA